MTTEKREYWIIKFPSSGDRENIGRQEYDYSLCAKKCG
jgi:serine/threonine-protein kinase HipA